MSHYDIEGIATVDSRGQIVLPKSVREELGLEVGSKLAVVLKQNDGAPCCVTLMPAARLESRVRELIDSGGSDV